jgi:hypothetical protein
MATTQPAMRRWLRVLLMGVGITGMCAVIFLRFVLPWLIAADFTRNTIIAYGSETLGAQIELAGLAFDWDTGLRVDGLSLREHGGEQLLAVETLEAAVRWRSLLRGLLVVERLEVRGLDLRVVRDESGATNAARMFAGGETADAPSGPSSLLRLLGALRVDARLAGGRCVFDDRRLGSTTAITDIDAHVRLLSPKEPLVLRLTSVVRRDDVAPEAFVITGSVEPAPGGRLDPADARGTLTVQAGFGQISADFDLAAFDADAEATGISLACSMDIGRLATSAAGILGLPPGLRLSGKLQSDLEARGSSIDGIRVRGLTQLSGFAASGGPLSGAPLAYPRLVFSQDAVVRDAGASIDVQSVALESPFMSLKLAGRVSGPPGSRLCDLASTGTANLHELSRILLAAGLVAPETRAEGGMSWDLAAAGPYQALRITGRMAASGLRIHDAALGPEPLRLASLELRPDMTVDIVAQRAAVSALAVRSPVVNADFSGDIGADGMIDMQAAAELQLAPVAAQLRHISPSVYPVQGAWTADVSIKGAWTQRLSMPGTQTFRDLVIATPPGNGAAAPDLFAIKGLELAHAIDYQKDRDELLVKKLRVASDAVRGDMDGAVSGLSDDLPTRLQVALDLDLQAAGQVFTSLLPEDLTLSGAGTLAFAGSGRLAPGAETPVLSTWSGEGSATAERVMYAGVGQLDGLRTSRLVLQQGVFDVVMDARLNGGPARVTARIDGTGERTAVDMALDANDVRLSQDVSLLGFMVPVLIMSSAGELSGNASLSARASWQGFDWNRDIGTTIRGDGSLRLRDGTVQSREVLADILKAVGKPPALSFEQIATAFVLRDGRIHNDAIEVNGKDVSFGLRGWTALSYDDALGGNPMEYAITGDLLKGKRAADAMKVLALLGLAESDAPVRITGTVQRPRVSINVPVLKNFLR